ncbi:hypothetical protein KC363_g208 [Hortaea werneckii]|nr:hypothetical protein KC363_g208 [Hortaea werneckii]
MMAMFCRPFLRLIRVRWQSLRAYLETESCYIVSGLFYSKLQSLNSTQGVIVSSWIVAGAVFVYCLLYLLAKALQFFLAGAHFLDTISKVTGTQISGV